MKTSVTARIVVPGTHYWPEAPTAVKFLRHEHRHLFVIDMTVDVSHPDRDTEFLLLAEQARQYLDAMFDRDAVGAYEFKTRSCEQIAIELVGGLGLAECAVSEDGENGARVVA